MLCFPNAGNAEDMYTNEGTGPRRAVSPLLVRLKERMITNRANVEHITALPAGHTDEGTSPCRAVSPLCFFESKGYLIVNS